MGEPAADGTGGGLGAWPLHQAAARGLGHGAATMDTLVSLAVCASFGWSVYALLFGGAGTAGMRMPFVFTFTSASGMTLYFEAAAGVTTAVLAGRYLEARARDHSGSALTALAALGAGSAAVLETAPSSGSRPASWRRASCSGPPGEKLAADGTVAEGNSAVDASLVTGESVPAEVGPGDAVTGGTVNMSGRLVVPPTGWARTRCWRRSPGWSATRRAPRRARSGWRTGSPPSSCPA